LRLLSRQASALEALSAIGYDPTTVGIRKRAAQSAQDDDLVSIQFNGSTLPDKGDFQKFSTEVFIKAQQARPEHYLADGPSSSR